MDPLAITPNPSSVLVLQSLVIFPGMMLSLYQSAPSEGALIVLQHF
jgi:hypothetical protein